MHCFKLFLARIDVANWLNPYKFFQFKYILGKKNTFAISLCCGLFACKMKYEKPIWINSSPFVPDFISMNIQVKCCTLFSSEWIAIENQLKTEYNKNNERPGIFIHSNYVDIFDNVSELNKESCTTRYHMFISSVWVMLWDWIHIYTYYYAKFVVFTFSALLSISDLDTTF